MKQIKTYLYSGLLLVSLLTLAACQTKEASQTTEETTVAQTQTSSEEPGVKSWVKQSLPTFTMTSLKGETLTSTDFKGKPMFIMEWASWCPFCQGQLPIVQELYTKYGEDIEFVMLNATGFNGETKESAQSYFADNDYQMPLYLDNGLAAAGILKVESVPTMFLVDKEQVIQEVFTKNQSKEELETVLKSLLD